MKNTKLSESAKRYWDSLTEEQRKARCGISGRKGWHHTEEAKQKIREARAKQKQVFDEKARKNMSEAQKKYWKSLSKEERDIKVQRFINAGRSKTKDTSIELKVEKQLKDLDIFYEKQKYCYNKKVKRGFYIDFYLPDLTLMIECNGEYWHNLPKRKERDELLKFLVESSKKSKKLKDLKVLMLNEKEIKENDNLVKEKLLMLGCKFCV